MQKDWKKRVKEATRTALSEIADQATEAGTSASHIAKGAYEKSGLKSKVGTVSRGTKDLIEKSGVAEAAAHFSRAAGEQFDTLSGAKLLALLEERLAIQSKYNDILATKLQEALERIRRLEAAVSSFKK
jgi:hypothetical protein